MTNEQKKKLREVRRKNKIYAVMFMLLGALTIFIEYDITFFIFTLFIGIPMFFSKKNWIQ